MYRHCGTEKEDAGQSTATPLDHTVDTLEEARNLVAFSKIARVNPSTVETSQPQQNSSSAAALLLDTPSDTPTQTSANNIPNIDGRVGSAMNKPTHSPGSVCQLSGPYPNTTQIAMPHGDTFISKGTQTSDIRSSGVMKDTQTDLATPHRAQIHHDHTSHIDQSTQTSLSGGQSMRLIKGPYQIFHPQLGYVILTEPFEAQLIGTLGFRRLRPVSLGLVDPITGRFIGLPIQIAPLDPVHLTAPLTLYQPVLVPMESLQEKPQYRIASHRVMPGHLPHGISIDAAVVPNDLIPAANAHKGPLDSPSVELKSPTISKPSFAPEADRIAKDQATPANKPKQSASHSTTFANQFRASANIGSTPFFRSVSDGDNPRHAVPAKPAVKKIVSYSPTTGLPVSMKVSQLPELPFPRQPYKDRTRPLHDELEERYRKVIVVADVKKEPEKKEEKK